MAPYVVLKGPSKFSNCAKMQILLELTSLQTNVLIIGQSKFDEKSV